MDEEDVDTEIDNGEPQHATDPAAPDLQFAHEVAESPEPIASADVEQSEQPETSRSGAQRRSGPAVRRPIQISSSEISVHPPSDAAGQEENGRSRWYLHFGQNAPQVAKASKFRRKGLNTDQLQRALTLDIETVRESS